MCQHASDVRAEQEQSFYSLLCDDCKKKVEDKLEGDETLFFYAPEEYGFCVKCYKEVLTAIVRSKEYGDWKCMVMKTLDESFSDMWKALFDEKSEERNTIGDFRIPSEIREAMEHFVKDHVKWRI